MAQNENYQIKTLFNAEQISERVQEIARLLTQDYTDTTLTVICTLRGSFIFFSDLIRELDIPVVCEFLGISSYGNEMQSSGQVKVTLDLGDAIAGKHVLIVEDIVDSGVTLNFLLSTLRARNPASLRTCALLVKPEKIETPVSVDYVGFEIGNEFVVGYGLDYAQNYRGLPYLASLEKEH